MRRFPSQGLTHDTYEPKSRPQVEAGLEAESWLWGREIYQIVYHGQAAKAALGFSYFHRSPSAGKREGIKELDVFTYI